jgi:hypothetical protein
MTNMVKGCHKIESDHQQNHININKLIISKEDQ